MVFGLKQLSLLVFVGWIEDEFPVNHPEVFAVLVDASLAQQQDLVTIGKGFHGDGPFLESHMAGVGSGHIVNLPVCAVCR